MDTDERKFYKKIRPVASKMELRISRMENEIEAGWPDVLVRGESDVHIWLELKVTRGPNARIKVRPEQINWAEDHYAHGGRVWLLAQNRYNTDQFWVVDAPNIRRAAADGCLDSPCYPMRQLSNLLFSWQGIYANLQPENPTLTQERSGLDFTPKRIIVSRAVLSRLHPARLRDEGNDRGPYHTTIPRRRPRGLQSATALQDVPRRKVRA